MVTTSENTYFYILTLQLEAKSFSSSQVTMVKCACLSTKWKYDVSCLTLVAFDVIL